MFLSLLVGFATCGLELLDGLTLAVPFCHETDIIYLATASDTRPAVLNKVCIVNQIENR